MVVIAFWNMAVLPGVGRSQRQRWWSYDYSSEWSWTVQTGRAVREQARDYSSSFLGRAPCPCSSDHKRIVMVGARIRCHPAATY